MALWTLVSGVLRFFDNLKTTLSGTWSFFVPEWGELPPPDWLVGCS